ncbi:MAG TPA: nucleotidyltransferase domain-containing protein [Solirubrobacterales bacterium]|jgi:predicted nucleotidyltransferase
MNELLAVAEEVGVDERTLRRAVNQGTVRAERVSPRKLRLPYREAQYLRRHWPLLGTLRAALRTEPNVRFALLFGSTARGDDHEGSDVDLLVVLRDDSLGRRLDLELRLEETLGRKVDVLRLEAAERNSTLFAMAVEEGRVLVDRIELWPRLSAEAGKLERRARRDERRLKREAFAKLDRMLAR